MVARDAVPGTKLCPNCGNILRAEGETNSVPAGRHLARELSFWMVLAAILGFLWTASGTGERVAGLGAIALLIWLLRRSRRRAAGHAVTEPERYHCEYCHRRFPGEELRELSPPGLSIAESSVRVSWRERPCNVFPLLRSGPESHADRIRLLDFWIFIGLLIGVRARPQSRKSIFRIIALGAALVMAGVVIGLASGYSAPQLLTFDKELGAVAGLEFRLIVFGYTLIFAGLLLGLRGRAA